MKIIKRDEAINLITEKLLTITSAKLQEILTIITGENYEVKYITTQIIYNFEIWLHGVKIGEIEAKDKLDAINKWNKEKDTFNPFIVAYNKG
jgi:hypothetical protein